MAKIVVELSPAIYQQLRQRAQEAGKSPEALSRELLGAALQSQPARDVGKPPAALSPEPPERTQVPEAPPVRSAREILRQSGMLSELSPYLQSKIIPGVTLEEVQEALTQAGGPPLSDIIIEQRGPKE
jgi:plasmid stability protein